jgi:prevent-host-death family protein
MDGRGCGRCSLTAASQRSYSYREVAMTKAARALRTMTARDLKNSTGEVVRALRRGESILLTFRGKPLGTIEPLGPHPAGATAVPPYEEAWAEIEDQLSRSAPVFASWKAAEDASRLPSG